jgi:hypothetical protein
VVLGPRDFLPFSREAAFWDSERCGDAWSDMCLPLRFW